MVSVIDGSEPIRSMDDFKRKYFPKQHEQEKFDAMTPEEQGKELARRAMEKCSLSQIDIRQDPTGGREALQEWWGDGRVSYEPIALLSSSSTQLHR